VRLFSGATDAEYRLFNSGGFNDMSFNLGPTDVNYDFIVKVNPEDIPKWKVNLTEVKDSLEVMGRITALTEKRHQNWPTVSKPKFYIDKRYFGFISVIYDQEGYVFKSINQN
jgi:hypothetical protein